MLWDKKSFHIYIYILSTCLIETISETRMKHTFVDLLRMNTCFSIQWCRPSSNRFGIERAFAFNSILIDVLISQRTEPEF